MYYCQTLLSFSGYGNCNMQVTFRHWTVQILLSFRLVLILKRVIAPLSDGRTADTAA